MRNLLKAILFIILCNIVILAGCNTNEENLKDGDSNITKEMDQLISDYIVQKYSSVYLDTEKQFEVHKVYGSSESGGVINVYMWSYYGGFNRSTGTEIQSGHSLPAVIKLKKEEDGYKVSEYTEPQDGSMYASSLKKMFPEKYLKLVQQDTGNMEDLQLEMDRKVKEWLET